jgi:enediyne biosynthesis protein E4
MIPSSESNISFNNKIFENDTFNVITFEYIYNGGGVGVGDVNNDGLTDVFFAGHMTSSKLYLNKGDFRFEDITSRASVETKLWCTGVSLIDINQDELLDIYVSTIQPHKGLPSVPNLLFLNKGFDEKGIPKFEEVAAKVGIADSTYSTQAAFLDYDRDGDLDMYLLNNSFESYNRNQAVGQQHNGSGRSVDRFYRNDGVIDGYPSFTNISKEAGILTEGWGLGVVVNDLNNDSYPDVYVANDFLSNDHMFINNKDGAFVNSVGKMLKHQEHNGMGMDIADINNDGFNDIIITDMMPDDNLRQKAMFSNIGYSRFWENRARGYQDQYIRNVLHLNNGNGTYSDIGYLSGIYATDWSWSSLIADFDNDGLRDVFISNGYRKDVTDLDFVTYNKRSSVFGDDKSRLKAMKEEVDKLTGVKKPNFLFKNNGDLTFTDKAKDWGLDQPSYTNGSAYADFDNDGDLDIVTNNINDEAFIYKNNTIAEDNKDRNNFLRVKLIGNSGNLEGIGSKIKVYYEGKFLYAEHQLQRGYKSTVENFVHFGLGKVKSKRVDSVRVIWASGKTQLLTQVSIDSVIKIKESEAKMVQQNAILISSPIFDESQDKLKILYKNKEQEYVDFNEGQALLPHKHSQAGPGIAVGDIDGDEMEDFIIGGAANHSAKIFYQQSNSTFKTDSLPGKESEDMGLLLFDADNDNDLDLYCVSGSSEFKQDITKYQDRFYRNEGKGKYLLDTSALPKITSSGSCVVANDFDKDGDLDLFIGGRIVSTQYPESPESYLLQNDGKGRFDDVTIKFSGKLRKPGMISSALWTDINNDSWTDLFVVGEWMPLTIFINNGGKSFTPSVIPNSSGWWNSISGGDFDNDGDIDYVAGNLGLNTIYQASEKEPVTVCAKDFDSNGTVESILCRYIQGKEYPVHPREALTGQMPSLRNVLTRYSIYGKLTLKEIIPEEKLKDATVLQSTQFASVYIQNVGGGKFKVNNLPVEAQFAPMFGISVTDVNEDGNLDILSIGNSYAPEPLTGFHDAGIGNYLQGDGKGNFKNVHVNQSGFFVDGDAKALAELNLKDGRRLFLATQNRDSLNVFTKVNQTSNVELIRPKTLDNSAILNLKNGKKRKQEFYYGSGYLSGSSRLVVKDKSISSVSLNTPVPVTVKAK